jgi:HAD superfamily hydrolase (TIGR01549 family)
MALLANATEVPAAHADFLSKVSQHYGMALVSNFDHAPTARQVLRVGRVEEFFQSIVISDEHGWRKPHPQIFTDTLMALGTGPEEALFVGDSPHDDIIGAKKVGMDIAWVNLPASPLPVDSPTPEYTVRSIPELLHVLFS